MTESDWTVENMSSYSPNRFYTRASDTKGHREEIRVKLSPDLADALSSIVQSKAIPEYKTVQDIVRDAIVHRLHYLHESGMVKGIDSALRRQLAIEAMLEHDEWASRFETTVKRLTERAKSLLWENTPEAISEAKRIVRDIYLEAYGMTDSLYWRHKYITYLKSELGHLIDDLEE